MKSCIIYDFQWNIYLDLWWSVFSNHPLAHFVQVIIRKNSFCFTAQLQVLIQESTAFECSFFLKKKVLQAGNQQNQRLHKKVCATSLTEQSNVVLTGAVREVEGSGKQLRKRPAVPAV